MPPRASSLTLTIRTKRKAGHKTKTNRKQAESLKLFTGKAPEPIQAPRPPTKSRLHSPPPAEKRREDLVSTRNSGFANTHTTNKANSYRIPDATTQNTIQHRCALTSTELASPARSENRGRPSWSKTGATRKVQPQGSTQYTTQAFGSSLPRNLRCTCLSL